MNTPIKIAGGILYVLGLLLSIWATFNVDPYFAIVAIVYAYIFFPEKSDNKSDFCCGYDTRTCADGYTVSASDLKEFWMLGGQKDKRKTKKTKSKKQKGEIKK